MFTSFVIFLFAVLGLVGNTAAAAADPGFDLQDPAIVVKQVESFLRSQTSTYPGSAQISVDVSRLGKQTSCADMHFFLPSGPRLRPRVSVGIRCAAPRPWAAFADAHLSIKGFYYVATNNLKPGVTLALDDLAAREGDLLSLSPNIVFDASQLIGRITTQRIRAGMPIKASALRQPDSIQRGQTVRLIAQGAGFVATSEGQAMQSGAPGAQIKVRTDSGQVVSGTILHANTVEVMM